MQPVQPEISQEYIGEPQNLGSYNGFDLYPMPSYITLSTSNPENLAKWYIDVLGFGVMFASKQDPEAIPTLIHLRRRKYQDILIVPGEHEPTSITYDASGELSQLAQRSAEHGETSKISRNGMAPPMLHLEDPMGNKISFFDKPTEADQQTNRLAFDNGKMGFDDQ